MCREFKTSILLLLFFLHFSLVGLCTFHYFLSFHYIFPEMLNFHFGVSLHGNYLSFFNFLLIVHEKDIG